jgi:hypothetical protein
MSEQEELEAQKVEDPANVAEPVEYDKEEDSE